MKARMRKILLKSMDHQHEMKRDSLNANAMKAFVCVLSFQEVNRHYNCETAKQI